MYTYSYVVGKEPTPGCERVEFQATDACEAWHHCPPQVKVTGYELLAVKVGGEWLWVTEALEVQGGIRPTNQH